MLKREKPYVENPQAVNSVADNQAQLNTKESITELLNTKESLQTEFEKLWELYPRKQGKADAFKHYLKARKSNVTYEDIEQGIFAYKNYIKTNNIDMQYVKMGSTFFSQKSWGDDWTIRNKSKGNSRRELFARLYEEHKDDL